MSSNYPPGVTGNEPQIAGWDEITVTCPECGEETLLFGDSGFFSGDCEHCEVYFEHNEYEIQQAAYEERRMDEMRDERMERDD